MNIDNRYQNSLGDILTLLQQAALRFLTDQQVDLSKFCQYFKQFYRNLASLEGYFHESKTKFTKYLSKLNSLTQQINILHRQKAISLQPAEYEISNQKSFTTKNSKIKKAQSQFISQQLSKNNINVDKTQELNVIGEIQQNQDFEDIRFRLNQPSRGGTAKGQRHKMSLTIDIHNQRPFTGKKGRPQQKNLSKQRYRSLTKYQKTNDQINQHVKDHLSQTINTQKIFKVNNRKSIYDFLEQQKKSKKSIVVNDELFVHDFLKLPDKKNSKSFSRWSFKINKLL